MTHTIENHPTVLKILFVGMGGVGGFYGGLLAKYFQESETVQVCFLARGTHLQAIQENGLKVHFKEETILCKPYKACSDATELGVVDYVVLCTKDYDLEATLQQLKPCVGKQTVLLPLLNGVKAFEEVQAAFPTNEVWKGCTYIVSRITAPGVVENKSGRQRLLFGLDSGVTTRMKQFETLLQAARIKAQATDAITTEVWEKYILVSTSATVTTYFNASFGAAMTTYKETTHQLLEEAVSLARAKGVALASDIVEVITDRLKAIPGDSTTSMHSDYLAAKKATELNIMTGYFVEQAQSLGVDVPTYTKIMNSLKDRAGEAYISLAQYS